MRRAGNGDALVVEVLVQLVVRGPVRVQAHAKRVDRLAHRERKREHRAARLAEAEAAFLATIAAG